MGIFSTNIYGAESSTLEGLDPNAEVNFGLESANFTAMGFEVCAEAEANYNMIMKSVGVNELNYFEENGQEIVYEAGGAGFLETIKKFFINLWNKVKEIFHKFFAWLGSLTKSHKDFAKKYEKEARDKWNKIKDEFSIKGYKFTIPDSPKYMEADESMVKFALKTDNSGNNIISGSNTAEVLESMRKLADDKERLKSLYDTFTAENKAAKDNSSDIVEGIRGACVAAQGFKNNTNPGSLTADEFAKELFEGYRDGDSEKQTLEKDDLDFETAITELKSYDKAKKTAERSFKAIRKEFDTAIRGIENIQKALTNKTGDDRATIKDGDKTKDATSAYLGTVNNILSNVKTTRECLVTLNSAFLQALKDRANQDKQFVAALVTTSKVTKESANTSYTSESAASMDFLSGINFI